MHIFQVEGKGFGPEVADSKKSNWDQQCMDVIENPNMMVPWYLMASYAYYVEDDPILSDGLFDGLAHSMLESWDTIEHWHKISLSSSADCSGNVELTCSQATTWQDEAGEWG